MVCSMTRERNSDVMTELKSYKYNATLIVFTTVTFSFFSFRDLKLCRCICYQFHWQIICKSFIFETAATLCT